MLRVLLVDTAVNSYQICRTEEACYSTTQPYMQGQFQFHWVRDLFNAGDVTYIEVGAEDGFVVTQGTQIAERVCH